MHFRPAEEEDLDELVSMQEEASVVALGHVFIQSEHPFPRAALLDRWRAEVRDPEIAVYVSTDEAHVITGFAARRADELLHFGTALTTWGSGLADHLLTALLATYPDDAARIWLNVFEENHRARRFWERNGWRPTGRTSRSTYEPCPVLLEYELNLVGRRS